MGYVVPDLQRKLPGRGVWVHVQPQAGLGEAVKKRLFSRGFERRPSTAPELAETVGRLLRKQAAFPLVAGPQGWAGGAGIHQG